MISCPMSQQKTKRIEEMKNEKFGLRSPWVLYFEKMNCLFGGDKEIKLDFDEEDMVISIRVDNPRKASALSRLIPCEVPFGTVTVNIGVIPNNSAMSREQLSKDASPIEVITAALEGNSAVAQIRAVSKGLFRNLCYCVFKKEVIQYGADSIGDINGNESTLMQNIATEIFEYANGVYFCTSAGDNGANGFGDAPLGEWP